MRYICNNPNCGSELTSTKGAILQCPKCGTDLVGEHKDGYKGVWMSPETVISRFETIINKFGAATAIKDGRFKREREAWVSGVWGFGITQLTKKQSFIEIETIEQTPDNHVFYFDEIDGNNHRQIFDVEVVDWEEHTEDLMEVIRNKCKKNYPDTFTLLVYGRHPGKIVSMESIYAGVQSIKVPFGQIWVLANASENEFEMFQMYPVKNHSKFNLAEMREKFKDQPAFSKFLMRGKGTIPENLGTFYLPIPQ
jgi:hypothetical protein